MKLQYLEALNYYNKGRELSEELLSDLYELEKSNDNILEENIKDKSKIFTDCMSNGQIDPVKAYDKVIRLMSLAVLRSKYKNRQGLEQILVSGFEIVLNANDFFYFATAMCVRVDVDDLEWIVPVVNKYPKCGLHAVMSYIMDLMPIKPYITEEFTEALEYLKKLNPEVFSKDLN